MVRNILKPRDPEDESPRCEYAFTAVEFTRDELETVRTEPLTFEQSGEPQLGTMKELEETLEDGIFARDTSPKELEHPQKRIRGAPPKEECINNLSKSLEDAGSPAMNPAALGPLMHKEKMRISQGGSSGEDGDPSEDPNNDSSHLFDRDVQMVRSE